jgi:hypothetical protein
MRVLLNVLATGVSTMALVACGGGGSATSASTPGPTPRQPSFSLVGPQDTDPVTFACGNSDGEKTRARYPGGNDQDPSITLAALPDGGVLGRTQVGEYPSYTYNYFWIDKTGRRIAYTARALDDVRVDMDGHLWWISADKVLWRGALQPNGQDERIGATTSFGTAPPDGPSSQLALGQVRGFASTQGAAFLLVANDAGTQYFVRRMTRNADAIWQSDSLNVPANVATPGDQVTVLANRVGQLALVVRRKTVVKPYPSSTSYNATTRTSYWQWKGADWREVASQVSTSSFNEFSFSSGTSLGLDRATLGDDGDIVWGGGGNATLYRMGQDGSWSVLARPGNISATAVGQDGDLSTATFLSAYGLTHSPQGDLFFYDAETCQVRKLSNRHLTTVSGPSYSIRPHFSGARLEFDGQNALVGVHEGSRGYARDIHTVPRPAKVSYEPASNRLTALDAVGSLEATTNDWCSSGGRFNFNRQCTNYNLWSGLGISFAGLDVASATLYALADKVYRLDPTGPVAVASAPSTTCRDATGRLYQSTSSFTNRQPDFPFFIVSDGGCPPPEATSWTYVYGPTLHRFDVATGTLQAVFPGKQSPLVNGEASFVQKRNDGGFWVAGSKDYVGSGYVIYRLTGSGDLVFVAGNHDNPAQAKDGQGSAAAFVGIKRIRNLADNRLLVLDANAVRLVDETGTVRTLFTLASSGIAGDAIVDMAPRGRDVYLTLVNQPMLMLAKDVLP